MFDFFFHAAACWLPGSLAAWDIDSLSTQFSNDEKHIVSFELPQLWRVGVGDVFDSFYGFHSVSKEGMLILATSVRFGHAYILLEVPTWIQNAIFKFNINLLNEFVLNRSLFSY